MTRGSRISPLANTETVDPRVAGFVGEFSEPSAFRAKATDPNDVSWSGALFTNRLGLANVKGSWRRGALSPSTVNCIEAKACPNATSGTAKLIWVEETYSSGADIEPKLRLTPASVVVALSSAITPAAGPRPAPKTVRSCERTADPTGPRSAESTIQKTCGVPPGGCGCEKSTAPR